MKKALYLKLSQQEANKKLQQIFVERYKNVQQRNHILGWLYFPFAYIGFSIVAIISYISRLTTFFQDIRFTPHYLRTVIRYNNMSSEQANEYLNSQMQEYKSSLSYGNFSSQERNSIDTTFELLYSEYRLPEPEDKKHFAVISGLSEVKNISLENNRNISIHLTSIKESITNEGLNVQESISTLSTQVTEQTDIVKDEFLTANKSLEVLSGKQDTVLSNISGTLEKLNNINNEIISVQSNVTPVALYTSRKQDEELQEKEHQEELRKEQEKRQMTAHNREKGKMLTSFESALTDKQINILVDYCNQVPVFERDIEFREMKDILLCVHKKPLKLTVNKYLSLLFTELCNKKLICKNWKSVAFRHKCFVSVNDNVLDSNDYYMANQTSGLIDPEKYDLIMECVDKIINPDHK